MNQQINHELSSAYTYLSMSAYCEALTLPGFARWLRVQSQEEIEHAMKFYDFINDRGGRVMLQTIEQPPVEFASLLDVFQKAYENEQQVTGQIHDLYALALRENDYPSQEFLHWFIDEQVEEEKLTSDAVAMLAAAGDHAGAILMLDREFGARDDEG
jgi:ferritin